MKKLFWGTPAFDKDLACLYGRAAFPPEAEKAAAEIIADVRRDGDAALVRYAKKFDRVDLAPEEFRVTEKELAEAGMQLPAGDRRAIRTALSQIRAFARLTRPKNWRSSPRPGVIVGEKFTPMERVGVYIPGGTAPLVSTVIHTAGIAKAAGVREVVAVTPPGRLHPATLYAMTCAGVTEVYRLGGVYGVAALAVGTKTIPKVEKIAGPGNAYVTAAKKLLYGEVAIDLVAGPSEILVVADETANPAFVAADLLSQAEHGSGLEQAVLVTTSKKLIDAVEKEILRQKALLSRQETIANVLERGMFLIWVPDLSKACELAGKYAPEHLELQVASPEKWYGKIDAAGAIFMGQWTPEPVGDFCAGPSHVLPTASSARSFNGLETSSFFRRTSIVKYTQSALMREAEIVERFGSMEGLDAHAMAATIRRDAKKR
jgi:histidinol dehydrogenase